MKYFLSVITTIVALPFCINAQQKNLAYFINNALATNPTLIENTNLQQSFNIQNEIIEAQNKKPQVSLTADYLFAPYFSNNGKIISISPNPSSKAYGFDPSITNGGLYAALMNVSVPVFNKAVVNTLHQQNNAQAAVSANSKLQIVQNIKKNITDQYILTYQYQVQGDYLKKIITQLENRKPLIIALVKQGLLQQNDFLLLDIQALSASNDLKQIEFALKSGIAQLKTLAQITDTASFTLEKPIINLNPNSPTYFYEQKFILDSMNLIADNAVFNTKYKPQVNILGSAGLNSTEAANIPHNVGFAAGIHVGIPIYDGKQRKLNEQKNKILLTNLQAYRNSAVIAQQNNLRNARLQIDQWQQTEMLLNEQIKKQELLLDIIKEKVVKGQVSVADYILAIQDYTITQKNKAIAQTNILLYTNQYNYANW
jgi:outer membrane protein TolC